MSGDDDRKGFNWPATGCAAYLLIGTFWTGGNFFVWTMGPCPAFSSSDDCYWSPAEKFFYFPGSQILFVVVGIALALFLKRFVRR